MTSCGGTVLMPTKGSDKAKILNAVDTLTPGGTTAGEAGIREAYKLAEQSFIKDGINRVMLATDGDFNVGQTDDDDLKRLIDKTQFAISTEETRYYLNGIYLHTAGTNKAPTLRGVATDGHRLAQFELPLPAGAEGMPGIIVPRKTGGEVQRLIEDNEAEVTVELSQGKIRFTLGDAVLTSKLIDGTFPDYARVIPVANDKELTVDKKEFEQAVDRVSTVSSERGRAVKLSLANGKLMLSVTNPDSGSATEEIEVEYAADPLDIGFNSRYLLDIAAQIESEAAVLKLADPGSPTLIQDKDAKGALYVLMPMRV